MWSSLLLLQCAILPSLISILSHLQNEETHVPLPLEYTGLNYTQSESKSMKQLRLILSDVIQKDDLFTEDQFLLLWLRQKNMNLGLVNHTIREAMKWRAKNRMEGILEEEILTAYPDLCWVDGVAYDGSPIIYISAVDIRRLVLIGQGNNFTRRIFQCIETAMRKSSDITKRTGKIVNQAIAIIDSSKFNLVQHSCLGCIQTYLRFIRDSEKFWPDYLKLVILINSPTIAKSLIDTVEPFISPQRRNMIRTFGVDKNEWLPYLQSIISPNQLSAKFGGKKL